MKFDTRDKKPKLYTLLIETVLVAAITALLIFDGAHKNAVLISIVFDAFFILAVIQLLVAFRRQLQYNPYSYNTIYYMGFALFLTAVWIMLLYVTFFLISFPGVYDIHNVFRIILNSAKNFMLLSSPFILAFSLALCISNISLIKHEGKRLVNVLGIILSVLMAAGAGLLYFLSYGVKGGGFVFELLVNLYAAVYLYFECMIIGAVIADIIAARHEPEPDRDFVIILGCGIRKDGTPSPILRGRIDRALGFAEKQKKLTGREITFVTSGGQGADETISESESMKRYLVGKGIPEERIIMEDRSTDTFENMKFSKEKILAANPEAKVAFSTTNYHVFRSGLYARRVKMRAVGMGSDTKWYFWPNASVREFVGLLTEHRLKQALIFGGIIAAYVAITILTY